MLLAAKCDDSEQGDDDEHDPGHGAGHTHFVALERIVVNQQRNQRDGTAGAAIIKDNVGTVEFLERLSNLGNEVVEDNGVIIGTVMEKNWRVLEAPSMVAASYRSTETPFNAARNSTMAERTAIHAAQ